MVRYLGIDPGAKGSLCILDPHGDILFFPTPNIYKTGPKFICPKKLVEILTFKHREDPFTTVAIEDVHSLYGMSAKSNFTFGRNVQALHTVLQCTELKYELVQPKVWQKAVGIQLGKLTPKERKQAIAKTAFGLYSSVELYGPKGGLLDGRSDALMIAHYLRLKHEG